MPQLSIIIPVYKVEDTLSKCVQSIIGQTFYDWELILVDDGSPDHCGTMCDEWAHRDSRIYVIHKQNGGLSDARNAGIEIATGEFITFVDSDDFIAPDTYFEVLRKFENINDCDIVEYPFYEKYNSKEETLHSLCDHCYSSATDYWYLEEAYRHCFAWNKVYRRSLFDDIRYPKGRLYEDILTLPILLGKARKVVTCSKGLYYYVYTPTGITGNINAELLEELLAAHLEAVQIMSADLTSSQTQLQYLTLMNVQLDVYRYSKHPSKELIRIPSRTLPLSIAKNKKDVVKIILLNILGLKNMCRLYHSFIGKR